MYNILQAHVITNSISNYSHCCVRRISLIRGDRRATVAANRVCRLSGILLECRCRDIRLIWNRSIERSRSVWSEIFTEPREDKEGGACRTSGVSGRAAAELCRLAPTRRVANLAPWGLWLVILLPGCIGPRSLELDPPPLRPGRPRDDRAAMAAKHRPPPLRGPPLVPGRLGDHQPVRALEPGRPHRRSGAGLGQQHALRGHVAPVPRRPHAELHAPRPDRADPGDGRPGGHHGPGADGQQRLEPRRRAPPDGRRRQWAGECPGGRAVPPRSPSRPRRRSTRWPGSRASSAASG